MYKINSIKFNFIMNFILTVSNFIFPLIIFPYVSRILLPDGTGKVAFATSIITYFTIFSLFGVSNYGVRIVAENRDDKLRLTTVTQEIIFVNVILMLFSYTVFYICIFSFDLFRNEYKLFLVTSLYLFFTVIGVEWFYKGLEQYKYITIRTLVFKILSLIAIFCFVQERDDYVIFSFITMLATVGSGILNFINLRKLIEFRCVASYNFGQHIKPMSIFFITSFAIAIYTNIDSVMLGIMKESQDVGYYNAAIRIKSILLSLITSLGVVLLPRLSYYISNGMRDEFKMALNKSMNFILIISFPITLFFILYAEQVILILAGREYVLSILPLKIIMLTIIFIGITNILGMQMLIPLKMEKELLISVLWGATANIVINFYLIPELGAIGASISTTISEFVVLIIQIIFLRNYLRSLFEKIEYIKIFISLVGVLFLWFFVKDYFQQNIFIEFFVMGIIFFISYIGLLFLLKEKMLIQLLKQIKF